MPKTKKLINAETDIDPKGFISIGEIGIGYNKKDSVVVVMANVQKGMEEEVLEGLEEIINKVKQKIEELKSTVGKS